MIRALMVSVLIILFLAFGLRAHSMTNVNSIGGIVYNNPNCDKISGNLSNYPVILEKDGVFQESKLSTLGGLYAFSNLEIGPIYTVSAKSNK